MEKENYVGGEGWHFFSILVFISFLLLGGLVFLIHTLRRSRSTDSNKHTDLQLVVIDDSTTLPRRPRRGSRNSKYFTPTPVIPVYYEMETIKRHDNERVSVTEDTIEIR
jgi:hypothetical protein